MIKVLLLGLGRWGANHLRILHSLPVDLFVADVQAKSIEAARKMGITETHCSTDPVKFLSQVEAAVIVTPAQTHFELARRFMEAGKDVFIEKPITLVSAQARDLAQLAEQHHRILQVGHIFRFDPASQWLRDSIQEGRFGQVRLLRGNFSGFKRPRNDSGVAFADAIHFVDLFNYLLGRTPARVTATMKDFLGRGMEDASLLGLDYSDATAPTWAMVETNYFLPGKYREVVVVGSELSAVCDYNVAQYKIKTYQNHHLAQGQEVKAVEGAVQQIECPPEEPLLAELRAFLESVQTRQAPRADGWAGVDSVRVLEAAFESVRTSATVNVQPVPRT